MRQTVLRMVCDRCGKVEEFETMNSEPLTATTDIPEMIKAHGWRSHPKEGSRFSMYDECLICSGWLSLLCADS